MKTLEWKEPPPAIRSDTNEGLAQLKANPGKWARVQKDMAASSAYNKWRKLGCEAVSRPADPKDGKPRYDIYARWPETDLASTYTAGDRPYRRQPQRPDPDAERRRNGG